MMLADLSFRDNHRTVERNCRLVPETDVFGNVVEQQPARGADEYQLPDDDDEVLSTASDADLILPDREDQGRFAYNTAKLILACFLVLLGLKYIEEVEVSNKTPVTTVTDHYNVLGVSRTATEFEINSAYRKLAKLYHPDSCGSDTRCTQNYFKVRKAVEILRNPRKRKQLDHSLPFTWGELLPVFVGAAVVLGSWLWLNSGKVSASNEVLEEQRIERERRKEYKRLTIERQKHKQEQQASKRKAAREIQEWWASLDNSYHSRAMACGLFSKDEQVPPPTPIWTFAARLFLISLLSSVVAQVGKSLATKYFR
uniref:J domain-containing protein n=1 Tax=Mucochytrium quahogii TaxID=96639 RepID=A0A7S2W431_9STRA|mmetsp:Transcript_6764/g.10700  ORF Transcript_6764/g.10700 Transcript_6764/m.10700 type:complete len:312 (-) Transcript_6764:452-1387(-)